MEGEVIIASSPTDAGIGCWDLHTGTEHLRYKPCSSPPHGLVSVGGGHFLASSQIRDPKSSASGSILYWSWNKPQVEVKSFPAEPIKPLVSNSQGTYIAGGGVSGDIYFWEVATGKLLKKWHAHYRAVTSLVFNDDQSLLISGSEDGCVQVWSLFLIFDDVRREEARNLFQYNFNAHSLRVTDVKTGYGGCNAIIVSASEDRTCKIWSLSSGKLLRNIVFPSIIDAISLDPGERVFYAGGRDGKIYIARLNAPGASDGNYGPDIMGSLSEHSKAVTCLASSADGYLLVSGSEDGMIRVWDTRTRNVSRVFRHTKGPINNVLVTRQQPLQQIKARTNSNSLACPLKKHGLQLPPPLEKFVNSPDENAYVKVLIGRPQTSSNELLDSSYITVEKMENQIKELQQQGSSAAAEVDVERLKSEQQRSMQMIQQWEKMYNNLHQFCVSELLNSSHTEKANGQHI